MLSFQRYDLATASYKYVAQVRPDRNRAFCIIAVPLDGEREEDKTMKKPRITFAFALTYLWVLMILLGAIVFETVVVYPNIFHDVPQSLETGMAFMTVSGPHDFFPPAGMLAILTGVGAAIFGWRVKSARYWIVGSVLFLFVGEFLLSAAFFWPRNAIMFEEGTAVHSVAYLQRVAREFQAAQWVRVAANAAASVSAFVGFLRVHRHRIISRSSAQANSEIAHSDR